jgi:hypothetical protein
MMRRLFLLSVLGIVVAFGLALSPGHGTVAPFTATDTISGTIRSGTFTPPCEPEEVVDADIYLMLDRTSSMEGFLDEERAAAKAFLVALDGLNTQPYVGVGTFGGLSNQNAANLISLTNVYGDDDGGEDTDNDVYDAIENATVSTSSTGTNLHDAQDVARDQVISGGASATDIIVLLTDGEPNADGGDSTNYEAIFDTSDDVKDDVERVIVVHFAPDGDDTGISGYETAAAIATGAYAYPDHASDHGGSGPHYHTGSISNANENTDGDDFYIGSTDASDMLAIFQSIVFDICDDPEPVVGAGAVTIVKDTNPNAGQDFGFTSNLETASGEVCPAAVDGSGNFTLDGDGSGGTPNSVTCSNVTAGSYTVTETHPLPGGYALNNIVCTEADTGTVIGVSGGFNMGDQFVTIDLDAGEHVTCVFTNAQQLQSDCFRSVASGNWNAASTWQQAPPSGGNCPSSGSSSWATAAFTPTNASNDISIRNGHTVTVTANVTADEVAVQSGGIVVVNNGVTLSLNNGSGTDMTVQSGGTLRLLPTGLVAGSSASFTLASGGNIEVGSTAGIASSGATGNIQSTGTRSFDDAANYTYNGTAAQVTGTGLDVAANLTINNSAGVTLSQNTAVDGVLTLVGDLSTGNGALLLTLADEATCSASSTGDVVSLTGATGGVRRTTPGNNTAQCYGNPDLLINYLTNDPSTVTVRLIKAAPASRAGAILRTYTIAHTGSPSGNATLRLPYNPTVAELNGNTEASLDIFHLESGVWVDKNGTLNTTGDWVEETPIPVGTLVGDWTLDN